MTYELTLELKNEGFPFDFKCTEWHGEYVTGPDGDELKLPTLSELIAECGDELVSINKEVGVAFGGKPCFTGRWHALGQPIKAKGDTPEEAVARLWLALKKNHDPR